MTHAAVFIARKSFCCFPLSDLRSELLFTESSPVGSSTEKERIRSLIPSCAGPIAECMLSKGVTESSQVEQDSL